MPHLFLLDASITNSLVNLATEVVRDLGLGGIVLMLLMSGVIGVPGTEVTMLFAGFNVYQGHLSLAGIIIAGVVGDLLGATVAYLIGRAGLHELLDRRGSPLHISQSRLDFAQRWFDRFGPPIMLVSRMLPVVRAAFPYAAGTLRMNYLRFIAYAAIGTIVWIGGLGLIGRAVGASWTKWRHDLGYVDYAIVAFVVLVVAYFVIRRIRAARR